ncbi:hypothetical protein I4U23_031533 [Adineta vaga]|nr:hypothetical protein I4U23_031533 [Adineta vaga]
MSPWSYGDRIQCILNARIIKVDQKVSDGDSRSTMRGAFLFVCQSRSVSTILALLTADAPIDKLGSYNLDYFYSFMPDIPQSRLLMDFRCIPTWENLYPIHLAIVDNSIELVQKLITFNTNKL